MKKVKEIIKWEYDTNRDRAVQNIYYPPRPKRVLPFYSKKLLENPLKMAASCDSVFLGMATGLLILLFYLIINPFK